TGLDWLRELSVAPQSTVKGQGGLKESSSWIDQTWSVQPAAMAGVLWSHFLPCSCLRRRLRCRLQKLYTPPTRYIPFSSVWRRCPSLRPRRVNHVRHERKVALSLSMYEVLICLPVPVLCNCSWIFSGLPQTTRLITSLSRRPLHFLI